MKIENIEDKEYMYRVSPEANTLLFNSGNIFESQLNLQWKYWLEINMDKEETSPIIFYVKSEIIDWLKNEGIDYIHKQNHPGIFLKLKKDVVALKVRWG